MTIETKELVISEELKELDDIFERINKKKHKTIKDKIFLHYTYQRKRDNKKVLEIEFYHQIWTKNDKITSAIIDGQKDYKLHIKHYFSTSNLNEKGGKGYVRSTMV